MDRGLRPGPAPPPEIRFTACQRISRPVANRGAIRGLHRDPLQNGLSGHFIPHVRPTISTTSSGLSRLP